MTVLAATYSRQSVDLAEGVDRQLARTRDLVERRGWKVAGEYTDDGTSAKKVRGPKSAWSKMLADAQRGKFTHVVAVDMDRLLRSQRDLLTLLDLGIKVTTVDGEIDLSTADGEFRATIMTAMARFEVQRKGERQLRANEFKVASGRPVPGKRRYGYERGNLVPRESEAQWVRFIFEQIASGASIRTVTKTLNEKEVRCWNYLTPDEPTEHELTSKRGTTWTTLRVRETASNQSYGGKVRYKGSWLPSEHVTPLVSPELAGAVQAIMDDPTRRTTPGNAVRHLLSGIALCGTCGASLFFMRSYRCRADTTHPSINKDKLEPKVKNALADAFLHGHADDFAGPENTVDIGALLMASQRLQDSADRLLDLFMDQDIDKATYRARKNLVTEQKAALEDEIQAARSSSATSSMLYEMGKGLIAPGSINLPDVVAKRAEVVKKFDGMTLDHQRELLRGLLTVTVYPGRTSDRIDVQHKIVTSLNEEEKDDAA